MTLNYRETQKIRQIELINNSTLFDGTAGGGIYHKKPYDYILTSGEHNLFHTIREDVVEYFKANNISWWGGTKPTGNTLSSQICCLNHLFAIRENPPMVLDLLNRIADDQFIEVLPITSDSDNGYIGFEAISDHNYLNEIYSTRGSQCTSIDALIYARHNNGERWIIIIEWKYTERYANTDKSAKEPGAIRQKRYDDLIKSSSYLKYDQTGIYYFEPFYQLMRQTLFAEQMIKNKTTERIKADNYIHLHVVASANADLLDKKYPINELTMERRWQNCLKDKSKYKLINYKEIVDTIYENPEYKDLAEYLTQRYL